MNKNSKFKYESDDFLKKIDHEDKQFLSLIPKSTGYITPGDVLRFTYNGELVNVLVVQVSRGPGMFISTQNNMLLACFKLDDTSESVLKIIIRSIYKDRGLAKYRVIQKSLGSILGKNSFRTYKIQFIDDLQKVVIQLPRLVLEEERNTRGKTNRRYS